MVRSALPAMLLLMALGTTSHAHYPFPCSTKEREQAAAIERAAQAGGQKGLDALTGLLRDENDRARTAALLGVMRLSSAQLDFEATITATQGFTGSKRAYLAGAAEATLILLDRKAAVKERIARLVAMTQSGLGKDAPQRMVQRNDRAGFRRRMGVEGLRAIGDDTVLPALEALSNDLAGDHDDSYDMKAVARVAFDVWWGIRTRTLPAKDRLPTLVGVLRLGEPFWSRWCDAACDLLEKEGERAVPLLIPTAREGDRRSKLWALRTLRAIRTENAIRCVREVSVDSLASEDRLVRQSAAYNLSQVADPSLITPLAKALKASIDPQVRERMAAALGSIGDARTVPPLRAALADADETVRTRAAAELARKGVSDGEDILLIALGRREGTASAIAAGVLAEIEDKEKLARRLADILRKRQDEAQLSGRDRILLDGIRNRILRELARWDADQLQPMVAALRPVLREHNRSGWAKKVLAKLAD